MKGPWELEGHRRAGKAIADIGVGDEYALGMIIERDERPAVKYAMETRAPCPWRVVKIKV